MCFELALRKRSGHVGSRVITGTTNKEKIIWSANRQLSEVQSETQIRLAGPGTRSLLGSEARRGVKPRLYMLLARPPIT
jgi:hypothetical protein